tara:strand:+ start:307 stop:906 length:600 start_codon:yes stop_codon:yes gene_type:complete
MGINLSFLKTLDQIIDEIGSKDVRMLELGNQFIYSLDNRTIQGTSKQYYEKKDINHTSIDINGKDEALPYDLSRQIEKKRLRRCNLITNFGTSEHVSDQYNCFLNIHNFCSVNGHMVSVVPSCGSWKDHCFYYYTTTFFESLSSLLNYDIRECYTINNGIYSKEKGTELVFYHAVKKQDIEFVDKKRFNKEILTHTREK